VHDGGEAMGDDQHGHPGKALFDRRGDLGVHPEGQLDPVERIQTYSKSTDEVADRQRQPLAQMAYSPSSMTRILASFSKARARQSSCFCP
jgi:hypothetical protein